MADRPRDDLPPTHRAARAFLLAVLVAAALAAGGSGVAAAGADAVTDRGVRLAKAVWRPLISGDGWVRPLLPDASPSPSVSPSGPPPTTAAPAARPSPTRSGKKPR